MLYDWEFWKWAIIIASALTYICWGFVFAVQALLLLNDVESAKEWFKKRYSIKSFRREFIAFFPMMQLFYILLEVIPHYLLKDRVAEFDTDAIWKKACELMGEGSC